MVELISDGAGSLEIGRYSPDATLAELVDSLARMLARLNACRNCCRCCYDVIPVNGTELRNAMQSNKGAFIGPDSLCLALPGRPDFRARNASIDELRVTFEVPLETATLLYEYNNADGICLRKKDDGSCLFLAEGRCARYSSRPLVCRLYCCRPGKRLATVSDMVVNQGVWHSYSVMGWIAEKDIAHNPFLTAARYEDILLKRFEVPLDGLGEPAAYVL